MDKPVSAQAQPDDEEYDRLRTEIEWRQREIGANAGSDFGSMSWVRGMRQR